MAGLLALAWLASENRRAIPWRAVATGMALLIGLAALFLKIEFLKNAFMKLNDLLLVLERATQAGTSLVFGYLGGGPAPFQVSDVNSNFVLAFRALPIVLVISALSALLFYWRVIPALVRGLSFVL
jgi:CNT family concentrative nucleoside transporter